MKDKPDIVCLQETKLSIEDWTVKGYIPEPKIYKREIACGGVLVLVRNDRQFRPVPLRTPLQAAAVRCTLHRPVTICSVYIPGDVDLRAMEELLHQLPTPFLITGDFNAHSPLWGGEFTDQNGARVESFLVRNHVHLANSGQTTRLDVSTMKESALDLTFCDPELATTVDWFVVKDGHGSDHFPAHITITPPQIMEVPKRWSLKRANWEDFTKECLQKINERTGINSYDDFIKTLTNICESNIPTTSGKARKHNSWFSKECRLAVVEKRKAYRKASNNPTVENIISFKKARAKARKVIREQKRGSFQTFVSSIGNQTPLNKVWKMIRNLKGTGSAPSAHHLNRADGSVAETKKEIADEIAGRLAFNSSSEHYSHNFLRAKQRAENTQLNFTSTNAEYYNIPFTLEELSACLSSSSNTAPGPDKISYQIIRHLPRESLAVLLQIFNEIWSTQTFPDSWRLATVVPIPKPGKDLSDASNYRPISLTSCLCKLMEKMVNKRLMWYLEKNKCLSNLQCGFRKNRSTIDHLVRLESFIREAFVNGEHMVAVFFDLEKAFDTTWKFGILKDLQDLGLRGNLPMFVKEFLKNRSFQVKVGHTMSDPLVQEEGVPQGSILSPILFEIKINSIARTLGENIDASLYVDDFLICYRSRSKMETIERKLQLQLNKLQKWSDFNGFKFSPSKTVAVHFCRKHLCVREPDLYINDSRIQVKYQARFLGVIFDRILNFSPHIKDLKIRCVKALRVMRVLSNKEWGADTKTLLHIYRTLIRSKLDYASFIYGSAAKSYIESLDPVHHQGLRLALGAFRTSPVESLLAEADEPPLALRRKQLALQYIAKIGANPDNPAYSYVWNYDQTQKIKFQSNLNKIAPLGLRLEPDIKKVLPKVEMIQESTGKSLPPWIRSIPEVDLSLTKLKKSTTSNAEYLELLGTLMEHYDSYFKIYTDGSKSNDAVGCAFVSNEGTGSQRLQDEVSIFTAEATAISNAVAFAAKCRKKKILILSDSLSVLTSLKNLYCTDPRITKILDSVYKLAQGGKHSVFMWLPSHTGIGPNERVDRLAKKALSIERRVGKIPHLDARSKIKRTIRKEWERQWSLPSLNKLKELKPKLEPRKHYGLNRKNEVRLTRLRIGHTAFTHKHLFDNGDIPRCNPCNCNLTVKHILVECAQLENIRKQYYTQRDMRALFAEVDPRDILEYTASVGLYTN